MPPSGKDAAPQRDASGATGERVAKVMARAGLCSRREAEAWIEAGRVALNGKPLMTPAVTISPGDRLSVDGEPVPLRERTRLFLHHKPKGLVTSHSDPQGRPTVFDRLPAAVPRVVSIGRLDINTEGLLLLTNDGGLARVLELPSTGWLRRYRVRAHGEVAPETLARLKDGVTIDGVAYGAIKASIDRQQGANVWITMGIREGKNREIKRVLDSLGLSVNRLIRISFGPFQLGNLAEGAVEEVRTRHLKDQLGDKLAQEAGVDFDAPLREEPRREPAPVKSQLKSRPKTQGKAANKPAPRTARPGGKARADAHRRRAR